MLSIKTERQTMIHPKSHSTYNERQQKTIEMIDWVLEKYTAAVNTKKNQQNEQVIINNIIEELDKKREVAINKKQKTLLKDEVLEYGEEEDTIDYILLIQFTCQFPNSEENIINNIFFFSVLQNFIF